MKEVAIVGACRTPIGSFGGSLSTISATKLGAAVVSVAIARAKLEPGMIDEVIMGQILSSGLGQHPARQVSIGAGLPIGIPSWSLNKMCGSGLQAACLAAQAIRAGDAEAVAAGGMENMSQAPFLLDKARFGYQLGHGALTDSLIKDGLWDVYNDCHMGMTAESLAVKYGISREEQDGFAVQSQARCAAATAKGLFMEEIVPVPVPQRKGAVVEVVKDEFPRPDTTLEKLAGLRPAFKKDGTVTAGNSSGINDGAAAVIVMAAERARKLGIEILALVRSYAAVGVEPGLMGIGPVSATRKALEKAGLGLEDMELMEFNEAFAAQSLAVKRELDWDERRVNVNGGAIALGHPVGASGARILVTLLHEMRRRKARYGLAGLCIGGGEGIAMIIERI